MLPLPDPARSCLYMQRELAKLKRLQVVEISADPGQHTETGTNTWDHRQGLHYLIKLECFAFWEDKRLYGVYREASTPAFT